MFLSVDKSARLRCTSRSAKAWWRWCARARCSPGDKLPGTRELAPELGVSRKTVLTAYLELAADGWVETRPGSCTYVLDRAGLTGGVMRRDGAPAMAEPSPDGHAPDMDWDGYQLEGRFFGMPRYRDHWQGEEEWISFSRAIPDVRLFPFERIKKVSSQMLWDPQAYFFDYGHPQGYRPLIDYHRDCGWPRTACRRARAQRRRDLQRLPGVAQPAAASCCSSRATAWRSRTRRSTAILNLLVAREHPPPRRADGARRDGRGLPRAAAEARAPAPDHDHPHAAQSHRR